MMEAFENIVYLKYFIGKNSKISFYFLNSYFLTFLM